MSTKGGPRASLGRRWGAVKTPMPGHAVSSGTGVVRASGDWRCASGFRVAREQRAAGCGPRGGATP
jgi:hypothetical protein